MTGGSEMGVRRREVRWSFDIYSLTCVLKMLQRGRKLYRNCDWVKA